MTEQNLRIATWNCNHGAIDDRYALLKKIKPHLAIIQEIQDLKRKNDEHFIWIPSRLTDKKGVAIISSEGLSMSLIPPSIELPEIFIPVIITGRITFNLLAVWTLDKKDYTGSFEPILSAYRNFLSQPSIIIGDFNSTPKGERENKKFNHNRLVERLGSEYNLVSAYHTKNNSLHGREKDQTFFMHGHPDKPFHIDYCFVPKSWTIECAKIGSYDNWCNEEKIDKDKISDHCPLIVDLMMEKAG
jgi:exonuclease III